MIQRVLHAPWLSEGLQGVLPMCLAYLLSALRVVGFVSPVGISFTAACRRQTLPAVVFGSVLGYILPLNGGSSQPSAAAVLLVAVLRLLYKKETTGFGDKVLLSCLSGAVCLLTLTVTCMILQLEPAALLIALGTAAICGVFTFLSYDVVRFLHRMHFRRDGHSRREQYALILFGIIAAASLMGLQLGAANLGRVVCAAAVMIAGTAFGGMGGACSGISFAAASLLQDPNARQQALMITFAALGCGIFGKDSKIASAISWTVFYTILCGGEWSTFVCVGESVGACALLLAFPTPGGCRPTGKRYPPLC